MFGKHLEERLRTGSKYLELWIFFWKNLARLKRPLLHNIVAVMEIASGKSTDQLFQKIAQPKAILIFSAMLAKRGNLNLDLNIDLHDSKTLAILMLAPVFLFANSSYWCWRRT